MPFLGPLLKYYAKKKKSLFKISFLVIQYYSILFYFN